MIYHITLAQSAANLVGPGYPFRCWPSASAGPVWMMQGHIHRSDWPALRVFERLREEEIKGFTLWSNQKSA